MNVNISEEDLLFAIEVLRFHANYIGSTAGYKETADSIEKAMKSSKKTMEPVDPSENIHSTSK